MSNSDDDKKIRHAIKGSKVLNEEERKAARASRLPVNSSQSRVGIQLQRIPNESNFRQVVKGPLAHCQLRTPHVFVVDEKAIMPVTADLSSPLTTPLALQITSKDCTKQTAAKLETVNYLDLNVGRLKEKGRLKENVEF